MEKIYVTPEMEITEFETEDIITTSNPYTDPSDDQTPFVPFNPSNP
ncbi:MAG: hypothetical protein IJ555_08220 [Ruminococcus sp.]|nr:hypothetical protein [Ruminococcus sp.]